MFTKFHKFLDWLGTSHALIIVAIFIINGKQDSFTWFTICSTIKRIGLVQLVTDSKLNGSIHLGPRASLQD